ncbi:luciferase family oxidoreductase group 1 [Duganella sp. 1411]|uniref:MsnO8 family LLM class oxidoreductase n=1 Tax=Duganella sp. 1411 TaxID=2806572 RepID=UPI001AEAA9D5|nr:MsnO8 family LLM class oxidoreductase [Duganella sp. 1411]MBP1205033.1 luciferase family oxidoreductase group 1 [Duganella sp. 1411]
MALILRPLPLSVLDLVPVRIGQSLAQSLRDVARLAQGAERLGYRRYWLAEHHNAAAFASAATAVLMGYAAGATSSIRIGAGGVMLPNHAPLMVAEQFGTLALLYPERIDLGVGRASGADPAAGAHLARGAAQGGAAFSAMLGELVDFLAEPSPRQAVRAVPGAGLALPVWILGASAASAAFAASRGMPFVFGGHLKAAGAAQALQTYRREFRAAAGGAGPRALLSVNLIAADSDAEAARLGRSRKARLRDMLLGRPRPLFAPEQAGADDLDGELRGQLAAAGGIAIEGGAATIAAQLDALIADCQPDELLLHTEIHDFEARLRSYAIAARVFGHA